MARENIGKRKCLFALFITALLFISHLSISDEAQLEENGQYSAGTDNNEPDSNEPSDIQQSAALTGELGDGIPFSCGVRSSKENATNATMLNNVIWSFFMGEITQTPGNQTEPVRIETGERSAIVYELPKTIKVNHLDRSGNETYDGQTFHRNFTVPVDITIAVYPDTTLEIGYVGEYNYSDRDDDGNPIQDNIYLEGRIGRGKVVFNVEQEEGRGLQETGTRSEAANEYPLIEVFSRSNESTEVGNVGFEIPVMNVHTAIFRAGISDEGEVEAVAFNGEFYLLLIEYGEEYPFVSYIVEPGTYGNPQGVFIDEVSGDVVVEAERVEVDVVKITGDLDYINSAASPPIYLHSMETLIFLEPGEMEYFSIDSDSTYSIEATRYKVDKDEALSITISDIEPGDMDTIQIGNYSVSFHTDSAHGKTITIEFEEGGQSFNVEIQIDEGEESEIYDVDLENSTATIALTDRHGETITVKIHSGDTRPPPPPPPPNSPPRPRDDDDEFVIAGMNGYVLLLGLGLPLLIMAIAVVMIIQGKRKVKQPQPVEEPEAPVDTDSEAEYMPQREGKERNESEI